MTLIAREVTNLKIAATYIGVNLEKSTVRTYLKPHFYHPNILHKHTKHIL